mmetsp:Transcript_130047/g.324149  ORF Transcript_130047/g.324149 Transcript_130047/m.324149 type:complete len:205 (-) Transcript_130047:1012-1626(-)
MTMDTFKASTPVFATSSPDPRLHKALATSRAENTPSQPRPVPFTTRCRQGSRPGREAPSISAAASVRRVAGGTRSGGKIAGRLDSWTNNHRSTVKSRGQPSTYALMMSFSVSSPSGGLSPPSATAADVLPEAARNVEASARVAPRLQIAPRCQFSATTSPTVGPACRNEGTALPGARPPADHTARSNEESTPIAWVEPGRTTIR